MRGELAMRSQRVAAAPGSIAEAMLKHACAESRDVGGLFGIIEVFCSPHAAFVNGGLFPCAAAMLAGLRHCLRCKAGNSKPNEKPREMFFRCNHDTSPGLK